MEEELLKEIKESYKKIKSKEPYYYDRGNGTKAYCINRIKILRSKLLEMQKDIEEYYK